MKVTEFIEKYGKYDHKTTKMDEIAKAIDLHNYLPFSQKVNIINKLCDVLIVKNKEGFVTYDTFARYLLFTMTSLSAYTALEVSTESLIVDNNNQLDITEFSNEYDLLMENGWIFPILEKIGTDYNDFNSLLNMRWDEKMVQANSSEAVLNRVLGEILISIQSASNKVAESLVGVGGDALNNFISQLEKQDISN